MAKFHKPFGFNEKQSTLLSERNHRLTGDAFNAYNEIKKQILAENEIPLDNTFRNNHFNTNIEIQNIIEIQTDDKIGPKFCREHLGFVPSKMTSYAKFIKEIEKYQSRSLMIVYTIDQDPELDSSCTKLVFSKPGAASEEENVFTGVLWLTFFDDDEKMIMFEDYPSMKDRFRDSTTKQVNYALRHRTRAFRYLQKVNVHSPSKSTYLDKVSLDGLGKANDYAKEHYLGLSTIKAKKYEVINNLQSSVISQFNGVLV